MSEKCFSSLFSQKKEKQNSGMLMLMKTRNCRLRWIEAYKKRTSVVMVSNGEYLRFLLNFENGCCSKLQMGGTPVQVPMLQKRSWADIWSARRSSWRGILHRCEMNKPSSAETRAKPNSAHGQSCRAAGLQEQRQNREGHLEAAPAAPAQTHVPKINCPSESR